jgi:hypothetical protein
MLRLVDNDGKSLINISIHTPTIVPILLPAERVKEVQRDSRRWRIGYDSTNISFFLLSY